MNATVIKGGRSGAPSAKAARLDVEETIREQHTSAENGLDSHEADRRRVAMGYNEFKVEEDDPLYMKYMEQFKDPLIGLLGASALVSVFMKQYDDAISISIAVVIVVTVAFIQEYRSEQALQELKKLVPHRCHCLRNGKVQDINARELVEGDVIILSVGDRVPADCRLIEAVELEIDEASLTGESHPASKNTATIQTPHSQELALAERFNIAFMGTLVRHGRGKGVVVGIGENSEFGDIFHMMQDVEEKKTPLQVSMDELGKKLSALSFGIIGIIVLLGVFQNKSFVEMFTVGVSLAVAAIPEGLPVVVTVTLALGVMRMASRNVIVKKLPAVESLGSATTICVDKTGTLTMNEMTVTCIYSLRELSLANVSGVGYHFSGQVELNGERVSYTTHPHLARILQIGCICNNAHIREGEVLGLPTEGALLAATAKIGLDDQRNFFERTDEISFKSDTKWMAVRCRPNGNPQADEIYYAKGSIEAILDRCVSHFYDEGNFPLLTPEDRESIIQASSRMAKNGLRVVAMAYGSSVDRLVFAGCVGILDPPRMEVREAIGRLSQSHVSVSMITGDSEETACSIAEKLGFFHFGVDKALSGPDLESMDSRQLEHAIRSVRVFYRATPKHKLIIVNAFQHAGEVVAMTGDGVNDAPALKKADIGIAMGITGTGVSKEAADMILVDDNFLSIISAIEEGKCIFYNIKNFVRFQLSTSVAALSLVTLSTLFGYENPLNPMQILWINIIMDGPPAQSLGVEPVDPDVMRKPPRKMNEPVVSMELLQKVFASAILIVVGTLFVFVREMSDGEVTRRDTTITFTTFVMFDMFNALSCRSAEKSLMEIGLFSNKMFLYAVGGSLIGQILVIFFPPLQEVFQTEALSFQDLLFITILTSSVMWMDEARKFRLRMNRRYLPR
eukprot:Nk52_evm28s1020 gene=Nk52_evmTU28s1020